MCLRAISSVHYYFLFLLVISRSVFRIHLCYFLLATQKFRMLFLLQMTFTHLQSDIDALVFWTYTNSLFLNSKKCATVRFSLSSNKGDLSYTIEGCNISVPSLHCDLGIMVKGDLSWSSHHNFICSKAYSVLYRIHRTISSSATVSVKKHLYISLVRSIMSYSSQL